MKISKKSSLIALLALSMGATPAMAGKVTAPAVGVPGNLVVVDDNTSIVSATVLGFITVKCYVGMGNGDGTVLTTGSTLPTTPSVNGTGRFGSGTARDYPGFTGCNSGPGGAGAVTYPINVEAVSPTQIKVATLQIVTPIGTCTKNNVLLGWNNTTKVATLPTTSAGVCTNVSGSLHVPSLNIIAN
ncbi:hypothetical protein [Sphingopyxis sp. R3-92]|uniref:hypothetical protein n=1 Tax=Sphingopyxis sp. R3-92 TaxID=3158553 RepID=UPI003EE4B700